MSGLKMAYGGVKRDVERIRLRTGLDEVAGRQQSPPQRFNRGTDSAKLELRSGRDDRPAAIGF